MPRAYEPQPTGLEEMTDEELIAHQIDQSEAVRKSTVELLHIRWEWERRHNRGDTDGQVRD